MRSLAFSMFAVVLCGSCASSKLKVKQIAPPDYPLDARFRGIQGTVSVIVVIGADGRVTSANGMGADPVLVHASEQNAGKWVFGPFPSDCEFPVGHQISFTYRLEGKTSFVVTPSRVTTHLPDSVEIVARPLASDFPSRGHPSTDPLSTPEARRH